MPDTAQQADVDTARGAVLALQADLARSTGVRLPLRLWDGTEVGPDDAAFRLVLHHPWSARALLRPPFDLSAGEAYAEGVIDMEGDIEAAMAAGERLGQGLPRGAAARLRLAQQLLRLPRPPRRVHTRRARLRGRRHSPERDRAAIAFHYDLPQRFYETFLDPDLVYSCAAFTSPDEPLAVAQQRKLALVCAKLRVGPESQLLDVGCGWGSLLIHAARHHGARGVGVTLSQTQAEAGRERVVRAGLSDRVEIRLADYRELQGSFDAVASIGMLEHVGPGHLDAYAARLRRLVRPGGLVLNHGIVLRDPSAARTGRERTFLSAYVFPDGGLGPAWRLIRATQRAGLDLLDVEQLGPSYAHTLRRWMASLEAGHAAAVEAASEVDYRIWRAYMAAAAHSFAAGHMGVVQVLSGRDATVPLGRRWMLPSVP